MSLSVNCYPSKPLHALLGATYGKGTLVWCKIVLTTSGAVGSYDGSAGTVGAKPTGTGVYTATFPPSSVLIPLAPVYEQASGAATVEATLKSVVASTGVVTVVLGDDGTPADGTSGDVIWVACIALSSS